MLLKITLKFVEIFVWAAGQLVKGCIWPAGRQFNMPAVDVETFVRVLYLLTVVDVIVMVFVVVFSSVGYRISDG